MNAKITNSMFTAFLPKILGLGSEPAKKAINIQRFPLFFPILEFPGMYRFRFRFGFWCCRAFCFMSGGFRVQRLHFGLTLRSGFRSGFLAPVAASVSDALSRSGVGFGTRRVGLCYL